MLRNLGQGTVPGWLPCWGSFLGLFLCPNFLWFGIVSPSFFSAKCAAPSRQLGASPSQPSNSPELAIARWKRRDEIKCNLSGTCIMPDTTTLYPLNPPKIPPLTPQATRAPLTCAHPPGQEHQPRSLTQLLPQPKLLVFTSRLSGQPHSGANSHGRPGLRDQGGSRQPYFKANSLSWTLLHEPISQAWVTFPTR